MILFGTNLFFTKTLNFKLIIQLLTNIEKTLSFSYTEYICHRHCDFVTVTKITQATSAAFEIAYMYVRIME